MTSRPTLHSDSAPLPQKNGIDPVALILPKLGDSPEEARSAQPRRPTDTYGTTTVLDYMVARFYPHDRDLFKARFDAHEVKDDSGQDVAPSAPLQGQKIWYYRQLPAEKDVPKDIPVLYEDDWILAVDKPHFLNTAPNGSFVANTALTLARVEHNLPGLIPAHRLDRLTAGVLVFAKTQETRAPLQALFARRKVRKVYEAVAAPIPGLAPGDEIKFHSRITRRHGQRQVTQQLAAELASCGLKPNASSRITCLKVGEMSPTVLPREEPAEGPRELAHYMLEPQTGKTHQLRVHLWAMGAPIIGDVLYPQDLGFIADRTDLPLQLLSRSISFTHPMTGEKLTLESRRELKLAAALGSVRHESL